MMLSEHEGFGILPSLMISETVAELVMTRRVTEIIHLFIPKNFILTCRRGHSYDLKVC